jgi:cation diffusion facilitator CzcD-associated flavoprotein CzcO
MDPTLPTPTLDPTSEVRYPPSGRSRDSANAIDIAIVGAGPQALTLVTHLLQKKATLRSRLRVFDPSGQWLHRWHHQFATLEIPHLRSPAVHHPDPDPHALRSFAVGRAEELFPPYDLPGTALFSDFCHQVIQQWRVGGLVEPAQVVGLTPVPQRLSLRPPRLRLTMADGQTVVARRVVLALGGGMTHVPSWVAEVPPGYPSDRLCHAKAVDLRGVHLQGEQVLIVGSGLTSAHLAVGAVHRGATVFMMARRQFYEKLFDAEPGWLGPKYLKGFWAEPDWHRRWQMIQTARNGGSLTPALMTQLRRYAREGRVQFVEHCQVTQARWQSGQWGVQCDREGAHVCLAHQAIHRIWLATGDRLDIDQWSLLSEMRQCYPIPIIQGLPVLDEHLRWPGQNLFMMGGAAALHLGPVARNLYGGRMASDRIVPALTKATIQP